jgi:hypothetical protein
VVRNRTTIGFALILIAALVAILVAATGGQTPSGGSRLGPTPVRPAVTH